MQRRPMIEATEQSDGMDGAVITDRAFAWSSDKNITKQAALRNLGTPANR